MALDPVLPTSGATETLAGVSFPDPYRWLEAENDEVRQWQREQAQLASDHVRSWRHFDRLKTLVQRFSTERYVALPRYAAGRWFWIEVPEGASQAQVRTGAVPMQGGRLLFDPAREDPARPPFLSWIAPSPDGHVLACGVCSDGSENNSIRLVDVDSGRLLADTPKQILMDSWTGGVQWLPDSSGFFFSAISGEATEFDQQVYLHRRSADPVTERVRVPWTKGRDYRMVMVSGDGRHAVAYEGLTNLIPVALASMGKDAPAWRRFIVPSVSGVVAGHVIGDDYIGVTDIGASRGRLVAIALDANDPSDPAGWRELLSESDAVLRALTPVGDLLYLTEFLETYSRVRILDREGGVRGIVPLHAQGAVGELPFPMTNLAVQLHPEKYIFSYSSLTLAPGIYGHVPGEEELETLRAPPGGLDDAIVEDRDAISSDGVAVRYHIVRRRDAGADRPRSVLIWAYGGFNVALVPQFPGPMAAFVAAGGILVHAHLRGGSEYGREGWEGGRLRNKQNCYDDLYAIAEDLIAADRCTPQSLAVVGNSNGGLMAGVAATQRPDLWKAVIPRFPWLDPIGACRDEYGRMCVTMELADIADPEEVRRLASFDPYHLVREGVRYPAIFCDVGDTDPRCPAWHARKFIARLQAEAATNEPALLHVWENVGHGWATDKEVELEQNSEWLGFVFRHLGLWEEDG